MSSAGTPGQGALGVKGIRYTRMVLESLFAIGRLDLLGSCIILNAEDVVEICVDGGFGGDFDFFVLGHGE
jgi:hypothetical protein